MIALYRANTESGEIKTLKTKYADLQDENRKLKLRI